MTLNGNNIYTAKNWAANCYKFPKLKKLNEISCPTFSKLTRTFNSEQFYFLPCATVNKQELKE